MPAQAEGHALDPLTAAEITSAVSVLRRGGYAGTDASFVPLDLYEPDKSALLAGGPQARKAFAVVREGNSLHEAVIDLDRGLVERWTELHGVQSAITPDDLTAARDITRRDPRWREAVRRHGYDPDEAGLICQPLSAGAPATLRERGRRLIRVVCFDRRGTNSVWGRPIEGLVATVDLDGKRVFSLADAPATPVSRQTAELPQRSVANRVPDQPAISITGNDVRWRFWRFHYRMDARTGLVLSQVRWDDKGGERMVLYRGSLSEIFVPYMDPDPAWSFRSFMDAGEYGLGPLSLSLTPPVDCPANALFRDAVLADEHGNPHVLENVICLFERDTTAPLFRHAETTPGSQGYTGEPARELVVRTIPSLGNYDYVIDWVLTDAGVLRIDVGATGIDAVKAVTAGTRNNPTAQRDTRYGTLVAPQLVAVNHDHFFSFRLDVDVDGTSNTLIRQRLARQHLPDGVGGRHSLWRVVDEPIRVEGPVRPDMHGGDEIWRIENPTLTHGLGQHPGYALRPSHAITSLRGPDDTLQPRAAFASAPLWVSIYDPSELYAAGPYPNQSAGGEGLPRYTARHRSVAGRDLVLWYTMGFHHIPHPEDWPVLPTMWHSVSLIPEGFFDRNPKLDVPRASAAP